MIKRERTVMTKYYLKMLKHFRHRCVVVQRLHVIRFLQLIRILRFGFLALLGLHGHIHPLFLDLFVVEKKFVIERQCIQFSSIVHNLKA